MDDNAQIMTLEIIFFASVVILSLIFIYQLSPSSIVADKYTNDLKIEGDDALHSLYVEDLTGDYPLGYPRNKMVHYLITNSYGGFVSDLNNMLPSFVMYNIYIANETKSMFWCNSLVDNDESLQSIPPVTISHYIVGIDPVFLDPTSDNIFREGNPNPIDQEFQNYDGSIYEVRLEMWYI